MKFDIIKLLFFCLFALWFTACVDEENSIINTGGKPGMYLDMTRASQDIINNLQVYMFDGDGSTTGQFKTKVPGIVYQTDGVSLRVEAGKWDFGLVTAEEDISGNIISPVRGNLRNTPMWVTQPTGNELKSIPELRFGYLAGQTVQANQNTTAGPLDLYRNVAMVRVYIEEANGVDAAGISTIELKGVPTTLSWEGKLMPNQVTPTVSNHPMKGKFTIIDHPTKADHQQSDPIEFIIPAHRGTDFLSVAPIDTTEQKLTLAVDLALLGGGRNTKTNIVIPRTPRMNGILEVRIFAGGEVKVTADILSWEDKNINAGISNTVLETDKASVGLAYKDTVYVNTTADAFTVEKDPSASWLTVQRLGTTNAIEVIADVNTYVDNNPRESYFSIKANNLTKKIPVQQRPDRGTISVNEEKLFLSPPHPTKSLNVTSIGGDWEIIGSTLKAKPNINNGINGTTPVSFTRETVSDEDYYSRFYGDTIVVFKNKATLDTDTVRISNLFIGIVDDEIFVPQPKLSNDTTSIVNNVEVFGGDYSGLNIYSRPTWIWPAPNTYYDPATKKFYFKYDREENGEPQWDDITLQHTDDPDYRVTVRIVEDILVDIPEFHFFVVQFKWTSGDVDIKVGFTGNPTSEIVNGVTYPTNDVNDFNNKWVGWSQTGTGDDLTVSPQTKYVKFNGQALLQWGNDATSGNRGETAFFNAPVINDQPYPGQYGITPSTPNLLPRKLKLQVNVAWYKPNTSDAAMQNPMECNIYCYKGGYMEHNGDTWYEIKGGGVPVYQVQKKFKVTATISSSSSSNVYEHICDIVYDRKKHTAVPTWFGTEFPGTRNATIISDPKEENRATYQKMREEKNKGIEINQ